MSGGFAAQLSQAQARITELENSWSWRLSRPQRVVGGIAMRLAKQRPV